MNDLSIKVEFCKTKLVGVLTRGVMATRRGGLQQILSSNYTHNVGSVGPGPGGEFFVSILKNIFPHDFPSAFCSEKMSGAGPDGNRMLLSLRGHKMIRNDNSPRSHGEFFNGGHGRRRMDILFVARAAGIMQALYRWLAFTERNFFTGF